MRLADWTGLPPDDGGWLDGAARDVSGRPGRVPVGADDLDGDGDGRPDTVVLGSGGELRLYTDLDGDALADQELTVGRSPAAPPDDDRTWWDTLHDAVDAVLGR